MRHCPLLRSKGGGLGSSALGLSLREREELEKNTHVSSLTRIPMTRIPRCSARKGVVGGGWPLGCRFANGSLNFNYVPFLVYYSGLLKRSFNAIFSSYVLDLFDESLIISRMLRNLEVTYTVSVAPFSE